jgi:hypothetical protein
VTTAGTSANEKLSLSQPAWIHTFFGCEALVSEANAGREIPTRFSLADGVIR